MKDDLDMQGMLAAEVEKKKYVWQTKKKGEGINHSLDPERK